MPDVRRSWAMYNFVTGSRTCVGVFVMDMPQEGQTAPKATCELPLSFHSWVG
jgi:hypothetical protein